MLGASGGGIPLDGVGGASAREVPAYGAGLDRGGGSVGVGAVPDTVTVADLVTDPAAPVQVSV
jgi:hypothetical protein